MEKYRTKTIAANVSDRILRILVSCMLGISWFVFLWGITLSALTAGVAFGIMLWLCARQYVKSSTRKKEKLMRQRIGGELALEKLLVESPRKAAFRCALWVEPLYPLQMNQTVDWGVIGEWNGTKTLLRLIAQHPSLTVNAQQIVECVREAHMRQAEQLLICLTAPADQDAISYAAGLSPPATLITNETLIFYAGAATPATDEDLRNLKKRKQKRRSHKEWLAVMLDQTRLRKYFWYGIGMILFALLTRSLLYLLPASVCLMMYALGRLRPALVNQRRRWRA